MVFTVSLFNIDLSPFQGVTVSSPSGKNLLQDQKYHMGSQYNEVIQLEFLDGSFGLAKVDLHDNVAHLGTNIANQSTIPTASVALPEHTRLFKVGQIVVTLAKHIISSGVCPWFYDRISRLDFRSYLHMVAAAAAARGANGFALLANSTQ
ncbi:hypothetical protein Tco_0711667 [Tanacetum coccineum]